ncbi:MAG: nuclear transport factor 2 family protein [Acidobacteria bacterium]|nr:nuclear transport factor 2 family protein [Acidobacteriota bacterium]
MKQILYAFAFITVFTSFALGQSKIEQEIIDLEKKIEAAEMAGDMATLNKLVDADGIYVVGNPSRVLSKEELERRRAARKEGRMGREIESDVVTKIYGNTVIKTSSFKRIDKTTDGKESTLEGRHTKTFVKINGQWKLVAIHGTPKVEVKR